MQKLNIIKETLETEKQRNTIFRSLFYLTVIDSRLIDDTSN